jgi:hypothetical protein
MKKAVQRAVPMLAGIALMAAMVIINAGSAALAAAPNMSRSFRAASGVVTGSLVSVAAGSDDSIEPANTQNGSRLVGVAVKSDDSLLAVDAANHRQQIAVSGEAVALVSTANGNIAKGDRVGVSAFDGIGMKAAPGSWSVGVALSAFSPGSAGAKAQTVKDDNGRSQTIHTGFVAVSLAVGAVESAEATELNSLQVFIKSLTGRVVPTFRIILAFIVAIIALGSLIALVYASIYGTIIAIGRNPLAKLAIFRTLGSLLVMVGVIALVAGLVVVALLR